MQNRITGWMPDRKPSKGKTPAAPPGAGNGGVVPPPEHRWKPGQSGNPAGRPPNAGASLREWVNTFAAKGLSRKQIEAIARDDSVPWPKQAAAIRVLRTTEAGDLADMQPFLDGDASLDQLRERGVATAVVKKAKQRTRTVTDDAGRTETTVEREIELHDRSGEDFDRVSDRTEGKPTQRVDVKHDGSIRTTADGALEAASLLAELRESLGIDAGAD